MLRDMRRMVLVGAVAARRCNVARASGWRPCANSLPAPIPQKLRQFAFGRRTGGEAVELRQLGLPSQKIVHESPWDP
jgi:hypothetical protein